MDHKRVAARDPQAIRHLGDAYSRGWYGLEKDELRAIEFWSEAADLGVTEALYELGLAYYHGDLVAQDKTKGLRYLESAAMQGHTDSRHCLGTVEYQNGNYDRALRHFLNFSQDGLRGVARCDQGNVCRKD